MAKARGVQDVYVNRAFETVIMSAANAITFSQVQFGVGLFQGVAAIIHRVEWYPSNATVRELVGVADFINMALTNRDDLSSLDPTNQSVLCHKALLPMMVGTVVGLEYIPVPLVSEYSGFPGGGMIVPANPLYLGMVTGGYAAAGTLRAIVYITFKQLTDAEYVELIQTIMPANL